MNQSLHCGDCARAANGNCGKHLESYLGAVSYPEPPTPKTVVQLIQEAVGKAVAAERERWSAVAAVSRMVNPKDHQACGCKKCFALGQALQGIPEVKC